jgi:hypothetical protein
VERLSRKRKPITEEEQSFEGRSPGALEIEIILQSLEVGKRGTGSQTRACDFSVVRQRNRDAIRKRKVKKRHLKTENAVGQGSFREVRVSADHGRHGTRVRRGKRGSETL